MDRFKEYEANWTRNYNHYISSEIVKFAVDNHAKYINIENLEGFGKDKNGKSISSKIFVLRNWTYYQLQQYIEYKAAKVYILKRDIKVRKGAGLNCPQKLYSELTPKGRANAYEQKYAVLKTGSKVVSIKALDV